jgi:hypothetical protein
VIGATIDHAHFQPLSKLALSILMLLGRVATHLGLADAEILEVEFVSGIRNYVELPRRPSQGSLDVLRPAASGQ